jgi:acylphosphatase
MNRMKSVQIRVIGRVQGVGFRYYAVMKAKEFNISGFVKNMPDDTVFIEAEGTEDNLDQFVLWCEKGPVSARVDRLELTPGIIKHYKTFGIHH